MVQSSQTFKPQSIRLIIALATAFGLQVWTTDVNQAYLQSAIPLERVLNLHTIIPDLEMDPSQSMKLLQPFYGLSESADLCYQTLKQPHSDDLNMKRLDYDSSFHYLVENMILCDMYQTYVDDLMRAVTASIIKLSTNTDQRFEMKPPSSLPCDLPSFRLETDNCQKFIKHRLNFYPNQNNLTPVLHSATCAQL